MKFYITPLERLILESLSRKEKDLSSLEDDTKLDQLILSNILQSLAAKNLVILERRKYYLNQALSNLMIKELKDNQSVMAEVNQVIKVCMNNMLNHNEGLFKYKKVYMDKSEEKLFNALLIQMETFIDGLSRNKGKTHEQKVIFWGSDTYENITHQLLNTY
jgi:hypothetical protein